MDASPISLVQWLKPGEYRETEVALRDFANEVSIYHADVLTKEEARSALAKWFQESAGNAQYCFIGAHGVTESDDGPAIGLGASGVPSEFVHWEELWNWFAQWQLKGGLWLGACKSSDAASALSPFLSSGSMAIPHFYGFSESIYPPEIQQILSTLLEFTGIEYPPYLDEELALLRAALPATKIELYYPAHTLTGTNEFVNVDEMPERTGMTFSQLLEGDAQRRSG
jgi:hypothetical protein